MKVLVSAYACEPGKGSEPGAGWNWARAAARHHDVCVITRVNNRPAIERALAVEPIPSLRFVYLDLPWWARSWKRGRHGIRLYYSLWQLLVAREAWRLCQREHFDVVHHITFANIWLPALVGVAGPPSVLGPLSGGQRVPFPLYPALGVRGIATELLLTLRALSRLNPLVRLGWRRARVILVNNMETSRALPRRLSARVIMRPNACVEGSVTALSPRAVYPPIAICAGRLNAFKGVALALRAVALTEDWQLRVVGGGPRREPLEALARRLGLEARVRFYGPVPQSELWRLMRPCRALLLPSLKEGASFVAVEAQAFGIPVVAFDANGPAALAVTPGARFELIEPNRIDRAVRDFAVALERLQQSPALPVTADFGLDAVARDLDQIYRHATGGTLTRVQEALA